MVTFVHHWLDCEDKLWSDGTAVKHVICKGTAKEPTKVSSANPASSPLCHAVLSLEYSIVFSWETGLFQDDLLACTQSVYRWTGVP